MHTRPFHADKLQTIFPHIKLDQAYVSTYYPIRNGETIPEFRERTETFISAWIQRIESEMPHVKTAVLMSHAAIVIALGRAVSSALRHIDDSLLATLQQTSRAL